MGDYFSGHIRLGGKISPEVLDKIYELWQCDEWDEEGGGTFDECQVGDHDELVEFCKDHDIAVAIHWDSDHGWDADVAFYIDGIKSVFSADMDGDIVVKLNELQRNMDKSVEDFVKSLGVPTMPAFELVRWYLEDASGKIDGPFETYADAKSVAALVDVRIIERKTDE